MPRSRAGAAALAGLLLLASPAARPQTTVNPGALDQLGPPPAGAAAPQTAPQTGTPRHRRTAPGRRPAARNAAPAKPAAAPAPKPPPIPPAPPPAAVLPPPIVVPTRPAPPPEPVPVAADAPGEATQRKDGLRVTFGAGRADLNPATDAALKALIAASKGRDVRFTIDSYASGNADDPSTPRRLSLSRAVNVRDAMVLAGIASDHVSVRALGANGPLFADGPPDRVDIGLTETPAQAAKAVAAPAAAHAAAPAAAPAAANATAPGTAQPPAPRPAYPPTRTMAPP